MIVPSSFAPNAVGPYKGLVLELDDALGFSSPAMPNGWKNFFVDSVLKYFATGVASLFFVDGSSSVNAGGSYKVSLLELDDTLGFASRVPNGE